MSSSKDPADQPDPVVTSDKQNGPEVEHASGQDIAASPSVETQQHAEGTGGPAEAGAAASPVPARPPAVNATSGDAVADTAVGASSNANDRAGTETQAGAPIRVCRKCSTQSQTAGDFCPNCGARFSRRRVGRKVKILAAVLIALLLGGGGATAMVVKTNHDNQVKVEKQRKALQAQRQAQADQLAAQVAQAAQQAQQTQQAAQNAVQVDIRKTLVSALQSSVTKDAQKDVNNGALTGPILRTLCTPVGGGNLQDTLANHTGNWSCLAITQDNADGTSSGYGFSATINYDTGSYTWHLGNS